LLAFAAPAQAAKRVALVIGNNDYRNVPKLQKAVNDARTMGDTLKQLGFSVMVAENQRAANSQTLLAFDKAVEPAIPRSFFTPATVLRSPDRTSCRRPTCLRRPRPRRVGATLILADRVIERSKRRARTAILVSTPAATIRSNAHCAVAGSAVWRR
jgi:hypothetical protein